MVDRFREQPLDLHEVRDLGPDLLKMMRRNLPDLGARCSFRAAEFDDRPNLVGSEPKASRAADEAQRADMGLVIDAMAAFGSRRRRQNPGPLEIADGLEVNAGAAGELAATEAACSVGSICHDDFP